MKTKALPSLFHFSGSMATKPNENSPAASAPSGRSAILPREGAHDPLAINVAIEVLTPLKTKEIGR